MSSLPLPRFTPEQYLSLDRAAEGKSEYYDGEMFPIEAATKKHARVGGQFCTALSNRLSESSCWVGMPIRVQISASRYVYPDFVVVCGDPPVAGGADDILWNPKVVVEVLSPSTKDYCYGTKFEMYRSLPSVEEYILIAQDAAHIDVFRRSTDGIWSFRTFAGLESSVRIESLNVTIPLSEIYRGVITAAS